MFGLFRKTPPDTLKPLTEEEIRKKLYGSISQRPRPDKSPAGSGGVWEEQGTKSTAAVENETEDFSSSPRAEQKSRSSESSAGTVQTLSFATGKAVPRDVGNRRRLDRFVLVKQISSIQRSRVFPIFLIVAGFLLITVTVRTVGRFVPGAERQTFQEKIEPLSSKPGAVSKSVSTSGTTGTSIAIPPSVSGVGEAPAAKVYTIQVAVYENEGLAARLVDELQAKGLPAFYQTFKTRKGRIQFQICVGRFQTFQEADRIHSRYQKTKDFKDFPDSFVKSLKT